MPSTTSNKKIYESMETIAMTLALVILIGIIHLGWFIWSLDKEDVLTKLTAMEQQIAGVGQIIGENTQGIEDTLNGWALPVTNDRNVTNITNSYKTRYYHMEVTICKFNNQSSDIDKRKVKFEGVGINPRLIEAAYDNKYQTYIQMNAGPGADLTVDLETNINDEYTCGFKILSVK